MTESKWQHFLQNAGAVFADSQPRFAPTAMHFGDPQQEYDAAKGATAVFDVNDRTQIECTGADRASFLHNFCTNDVKGLQPGQGCEAFVTNIKAHVLGHIDLFAESESLWVDSIPGCEESLLAHLDRYLITEDVQLHDRSAEFAELFITGTASVDVLDAHGWRAELTEPCSHIIGTIFGVESVRVRRVDWFGTPGFLLSVSRANLPDLWQSALTAGAIPSGSLAFHTLRIESRFPWYGIDVTDENLAQEVNRTDQTISFTKGCYLGQEPIARIDAMGHVNRLLCGFRCEIGPVPPAGAAVIDPDDTSRKEIGRVTSATQLTADQAPVALGYLRSKYAKPETRVLVAFEGNEIPATVFG